LKGVRMKTLAAFAFILVMTALVSPARAHFGLLVPSDDIVSATDPKAITLEVAFMHPFEGEYMDMARPRAFRVTSRGKTSDILGTLSSRPVRGKSAWQATYRITRPGDYVFAVEPAPYWEPAEGSFIVHYTKLVVNAMGLEEGWQEELGLPVEIVPLTRPYGLWAGNVFRGVVKKGGRPLPFAEVEVEFLNEGQKVKAPADAFVTQVVKADASGVFTYAMPREGWWGFAALTEADYTLKHDGEDYPVELGAVIWVRTREMR
jgi:cobalt/nickel transport protein